MIYLTIINALPVKQKMKNAFCENHIFTRFNLTIGHLRVTIGYLRATRGHLRLTIGYLKATVVHIRVTLGHLKVTIGNFFLSFTPK